MQTLVASNNIEELQSSELLVLKCSFSSCFDVLDCMQLFHF